ncbi:MAG TPA: rRNA maturation RNase YbeY [Planctomycetes bacterium]|nr:rRNA maturation RNase YbeY [Fuerstiella sp.]HIK94716.1 rRNA maturation RNase YbeY [Planctomycetota bacterium]
MSFEIDVSCSHPTFRINESQLRHALQHGLQVERVRSAVLSLTVVDNANSHRLNKEHLQHDYPTDVISFQLDWTSGDRTIEAPSQTPTERSVNANIEGEVVVNADVAAEMAQQFGWSTDEELTLYAIHGMLHICGYDDQTTDEKEIMRAREKAILLGIGLTPQYPAAGRADDDEPPGDSIKLTSAAHAPSSISAEVADDTKEGTQ